MAEAGSLHGEARGWEPGDMDRGDNRNLVYIGVVLAFIAISIFALSGGAVCASTGHMLFFALLFILFVWLIFSSSVRTGIKAERVKHFNIEPDKLSHAVVRTLDGQSVRYNRAGPTWGGSISWYDRFDLRSPPFDGITVIAERNPLSSLESLSQCKLQSGLVDDIRFRQLQELIDERVSEERAGETKVALRVFPSHSVAHKPYEPGGQ